jgi:hypothetical protein
MGDICLFPATYKRQQGIDSISFSTKAGWILQLFTQQVIEYR